MNFNVKFVKQYIVATLKGPKRTEKIRIAHQISVIIFLDNNYYKSIRDYINNHGQHESPIQLSLLFVEWLISTGEHSAWYRVLHLQSTAVFLSFPDNCCFFSSPQTTVVFYFPQTKIFFLFPTRQRMFLIIYRLFSYFSPDNRSFYIAPQTTFVFQFTLDNVCFIISLQVELYFTTVNFYFSSENGSFFISTQTMTEFNLSLDNTCSLYPLK